MPTNSRNFNLSRERLSFQAKVKNLIHRLLSLPEIDAPHPGKEAVLMEIAGRGDGPNPDFS
jgi:hypothetical protein